MPLSIKDPKTERLARELAKRTGETLTVATRRALEERLSRIGGRRAERRCSKTSRQAAVAGARRRRSILAAQTRSSATTRTGCPADGGRHVGDRRHRVQRARSRSLRTAHRRSRLISAAIVLEAAMVIETRLVEPGGSELDLWLHKAGIEIVAVDAEQAD